MESTVLLQPASAQDAPVLANLLELYSHDLSVAFDLEIGDDGRFGYRYLEHYFKERDRRFAFLIRHRGQLAGFALVIRMPPAQGAPIDPPSFDVAEFFVLRRQRRAGVGRAAAVALWRLMPGHWTVRVADSNGTALPFWTEVIAGFTGHRPVGQRRVVEGRPWTYLRFDAPGPTG